MKRLVLMLALGGAVGVLAACDDRPPQPVEPPAPVIEALPPPVEAPPPVNPEVQPAPVYPPNDTLPPEQRESAETVKPESETLFY